MVLDMQLEVGDVQQSIDVTGSAPLLNTTTTEVGSSFTPKFMKDLPLFSGGIRNPEAFVTYMPGVNNGSGDSSINGGSRRAKEVQIDGASLTIPESGGVVFYFPSAEQFGEFKLLTNSFSAEYGRTGGGIELFLTKSGTNNLHGTVFDNIRRDHLWGANGWTRNLTTNVRNKVYLNELRHIGRRPGVHTEGVQREEQNVLLLHLCEGQTSAHGQQYTGFDRHGAHAERGFQRDPAYDLRSTDNHRIGSTAARTPFPTNQIPAARFSNVSKNIVPLIPAPTLGGFLNNYLTVNTNKLDRKMHSFKADHSFSARHRTSFWYSLERWYNVNVTNFTGPLSAALSNDYIRPDYIRANHDWIVKPTMVIHIGYGKQHSHRLGERRSAGICLEDRPEGNPVRRFPVDFLPRSG